MEEDAAGISSSVDAAGEGAGGGRRGRGRRACHFATGPGSVRERESFKVG